MRASQILREQQLKGMEEIQKSVSNREGKDIFNSDAFTKRKKGSQTEDDKKLISPEDAYDLDYEGGRLVKEPNAKDSLLSDKDKGRSFCGPRPLVGFQNSGTNKLKNHTKKKLSEALEKANFFNEQINKQYQFQKEAEEEENNFLELCDVLNNI